MSGRDLEAGRLPPGGGKRQEGKAELQKTQHVPPPFLAFTRVLGVLVFLCLVFAAIVWWQILREF